MRKSFGLASLIVLFGLSMAYGAANVLDLAGPGASDVPRLPAPPQTLEPWDFADPAVTSDVPSLPPPPDTLQIWDLWEPKQNLEVWDFGGHPQAPGRPEFGDPMPIPYQGPSVISDARDVVASPGASDVRSLGIPPDTLEIWDLWEPKQNLEVWDFAGHPQAPGRPELGDPIAIPYQDPSVISDARDVVESGGSIDVRGLTLPPDTLEIWDLWEPEQTVEEGGSADQP